jgi:hypothetical protein
MTAAALFVVAGPVLVVGGGVAASVLLGAIGALAGRKLMRRGQPRRSARETREAREARRIAAVLDVDQDFSGASD